MSNEETPAPVSDHPTHVNLYVRVEGTPSDEDDSGIPGFYLFKVDASLSPDQRVTAVLDTWHEKNGVEVLDDFTIDVLDADGLELFEADTDEAEDFTPVHYGHRVEYRGQLNDFEVSFLKEGHAPTP